MNIQVAVGQLIGEIRIFSPFHERTDTAICDIDLDVFIIDEVKFNHFILSESRIWIQPNPTTDYAVYFERPNEP